MTEIEQKPSWPRVGGVYKGILFPDVCRRVTAINDGMVYGVFTALRRLPEQPFPPLSVEHFRERQMPEDESPIPHLLAVQKGLVEALEAIVEHGVLNGWFDGNGHRARLGDMAAKALSAANAERKEA